MSSEDDRRWMELVLDLAAEGRGLVEPNPMVGCVLVRHGAEIGRGFHRRFGGKHAEIEALDTCQGDAAGATVYVNLEPCSHHGKTPPCVDRLIQAGVARVVVSDEDPFPEVAGRGVSKLREAGISVSVGIARQAARSLNAPYLKRVSTGQPWVIAKWAMTLDGKIATISGDSKWISCEASRAVVHQIRGRVDAIIVGIQTAIMDDPLLTARPAGPREATRIVVDTGLRLPIDSRLVATVRQHPTLIATGASVDADRVRQLSGAGCEILPLNGDAHALRLSQLLDELGRRQMTNILVEGGGQLLGGFLDMAKIDEVHVFVGNRITGGLTAASPLGGAGIARMQDAVTLTDLLHTVIGENVHISGRPVWPPRPGTDT